MNVRLHAQDPDTLQRTVTDTHLSGETKAVQIDMSCYLAPLTFEDASEPHRLLQACIDYTIHRADALIFDGEVPRALQNAMWDDTTSLVFARCRALNGLCCVFTIVSRIAARDGNSQRTQHSWMWTTVALDAAAWLFAVLFLLYSNKHGLVDTASIKIGRDVMKTLYGDPTGTAGVVHQGTNIWNCLQLSWILPCLLAFDWWVASRTLHPNTAAAADMQAMRPATTSYFADGMGHVRHL